MNGVKHATFTLRIRAWCDLAVDVGSTDKRNKNLLLLFLVGFAFFVIRYYTFYVLSNNDCAFLKYLLRDLSIEKVIY